MYYVFMQAQEIDLDYFRHNLTFLTRKVWAGKLRIIVFYRREPSFEVLKIEEVHVEGAEVGFIKLREKPSDFLDLLETNQNVFLTSYNKRRVVCRKIEND